MTSGSSSLFNDFLQVVTLFAHHDAQDDDHHNLEDSSSPITSRRKVWLRMDTDEEASEAAGPDRRASSLDVAERIYLHLPARSSGLSLL